MLLTSLHVCAVLNTVSVSGPKLNEHRGKIGHLNYVPCFVLATFSVHPTAMKT